MGIDTIGSPHRDILWTNQVIVWGMKCQIVIEPELRYDSWLLYYWGEAGFLFHNDFEFLVRQVNLSVQPQEFIFSILEQNCFTDSNMWRHREVLNNDAGGLVLLQQILWNSKKGLKWAEQSK